jgi:eukaryotic-like serine/threonine-protein kinase
VTVTSDTTIPEHARSGLGAGEKLGPYEIRGVLGSGGLGTVYRAWDARLGREVALKVLAEGAESAGPRLADLEREARVLASLSHPNILGIFDVGEDRGRHYVATELLDGVNLRRRMAGRPLPWRTSVAIVLEVAKGLAAAHAHGIVHLDLKPENIFVLAQGGVKILDFGFARRESAPMVEKGAAASGDSQPHHEVVGTAAYLSPEQLAGAPVDHRSDLFSLGGVLFELLNGRAPFKRDTLTGTLRAIAEAQPAPLAAPGVTIPDGLAQTVRRCLKKAPRDRFQTAYDLAFALSEQLAQPAVPADRRASWQVKLGYFLAGVAAALAGLLLLRLLLH